VSVSSVEIKRRMGEDDIVAVATLLAAAHAADGHAPLGEHKWLDLVQGGRAGFAGFVAREPGHAAVIGYAQLSRGSGSWSVEYVVHPQRRGELEQIGHDLLSAALAEVAADGGGHVHLWVPKPTAATDRVALDLGLRRGRELLQLRRALPLEAELLAGPDVTTRPFRPGSDEQAWLALNARAFADHPEQGAWALDTLLDRESQDWFDPEGFLLYEEGARLGAFCWTKVHEEEGPAGEIYVIGVDPDLQGRGLGRALLRAGLRHLQGLPVPVAMIYVDADNAPARRLYEAFGFVIDHHDLAYVIDVAPAP
jgi:mycothiol synthase